MRTLVNIPWIAMAWLVMTSNAHAVELPVPVFMTKPFVAVSGPKEPLHLGTAYGTSSGQVQGETSVHVVANCPYQISASFRGLQRADGRGMVAGQQLSVSINGKQATGGTGPVPIAQSLVPTPPGGTDVPIRLQVGLGDLVHSPAGRYHGMLVITVMAGP